MMPSPPACDTAAAISAKPTKCMPPWMIGCSMPNISVILVFIARLPDARPSREGIALRDGRHAAAAVVADDDGSVHHVALAVRVVLGGQAAIAHARQPGAHGVAAHLVRAVLGDLGNRG